MKANAAPDFPEKVYIPRDPEYPQSPNIWWERESSESNMEYILADTFIERARKWFEMQTEWIDLNGNRHCDMESFEDFRNYMKGE